MLPIYIKVKRIFIVIKVKINTEELFYPQHITSIYFVFKTF